jgi:sarcosine oxidase subunit alpha
MGVCFECRVQVDGVAHVRACMTPASEGMRVITDA